MQIPSAIIFSKRAVFVPFGVSMPLQLRLFMKKVRMPGLCLLAAQNTVLMTFKMN